MRGLSGAKADGAVVQLGERIPRTDEVRGSNPLCSTRIPGTNSGDTILNYVFKRGQSD